MIECGESSEKLLGQWFEFTYLEKGKSAITYPLIKCVAGVVCLGDKVDFKFCGDMFVPLQYADIFTINGKKASAYTCKAKAVVRL